MIKSELEYQVTQNWVDKFTKSILLMEKDEESKQKDFQKLRVVA